MCARREGVESGRGTGDWDSRMVGEVGGRVLGREGVEGGQGQVLRGGSGVLTQWGGGQGKMWEGGPGVTARFLIWHPPPDCRHVSLAVTLISVLIYTRQELYVNLGWVCGGRCGAKADQVSRD